MKVVSVVGLLPEDKRTLEDIEARVGAAYASLFSGRGSQTDAGIVLVDLAKFAHYYDTAELDLTAEEALALAQRRAVFSRVLDALTKTGVSTNGLHEAVVATPEIT